MKQVCAPWQLVGLVLLASTVVSADVLVVSADATSIFRYDQTTGAFLQKFDNTSNFLLPYGLAVGPDGLLYTATTDARNDYASQIYGYDPVTGHVVAIFGALPQTRGMAIGPDGLVYVSAWNTRQVWRYNPLTGAFVDVVATLAAPEAPYNLALDSVGNLYVNGGLGTIYKFDASTHAMSIFISDPNLLSYYNEAMAFGPDGKLYLGTSHFSAYAQQVRRYNGQTGAFDKVFAQDSHIDEAISIAFGPDGKVYVGTYAPGNVLRFDGTTGAFLDIFIPSGLGGLGTNLTGILFTAAQQPNWTQKNPANSPFTRTLQAMAYDPVRGQIVLFGGEGLVNQNLFAFFNDTWVWDGTNWTQKIPLNSPTPRAGHTIAYDAARGQVVLFGGTDASGNDLNDTWVWDGTNWTQKSPLNSPPSREATAMAYDAARGQVVLFGGTDASGNRNDTWVWDGTNWTQKSPLNTPPPRLFHAMAYDAARGQVVLFGGVGGSYDNDTWVWDGTNWTQKLPLNSPKGRALHAMANDAARGQVVLFGGDDGSSSLPIDTWVWDGTNWTQKLPLNNPPSRIRHSMAYDAAHGQVVLFGGSFANGTAYSNDTWVWPGNSASPTGTINVTTNLSGATFNITGAATYTGSGTSFTQLGAPAGGYTIIYGTVAGYITPGVQTQTLAAGGSITFNAVYQSSVTLGTPGPTNPGPYSSEPVNTATGNFYTSHKDLQIPGKDLALVFTRYYNSLDTYSGPLGTGWTHSYNITLRQIASGTIIIKDADGHEDVFTPSGGGNYVAQTVGLFDSLHQNADGSFTLTRKNQVRLNFSAAGQLLTIIDRNSNVQAFAYSGGNLTSITDSSGRPFALSYDASHRLISLADPLGRVLHYAYDASGNLVSFQDALGGSTQYAYDASHRMMSATDPRGDIYLQNTYDSQGRVVIQKNARGFATTFAYDSPSAGTTTITDALGNITKQVHDAILRWTQTIDALGGTTSYTYAANNLKLSTTDPLGRVQTFAYDGNGNLTAATDAAGKTTQLVYNGTNDLTQVTDRLGRVTKFTYDANGNLLSTVDAAGNSSAFTYSSAGQPITAKNARNFTTGFSYDTAGNLLQVTDALSGTVQRTYDAVGRLLSVKTQLGNTGTRSYDADNRLTSTTDPLGNSTQFTYDVNGNLTQLTDANGKVTKYSFDATNKPVQITDAIGGVTNYAYNGNTDLTSVTDANGHATAYMYDALRRLKSTTDPLGNQKTYGYDGTGNVISTLDGNSKTNSFSYDSLNRLISMMLSDGKSVAYTYDAVGNRLTMADWRGTTQYISDILNRVTSVGTPDGKTIRYGYDSVGNRVSLTNANGSAVQYQYDALNRLAQVTDWNANATSYSYDAAGNLLGMNQPNRAFSTYAYDAANRLLKVVNSSKNQVLSSFTYSVDKVGNRLQVISSTGAITGYGYDGLYRLTSWINPSGQATSYAYDAVGNRTLVTGPGGTTTYAYDGGDQLQTAGSTTLAYDGNGSLIRKTVGSTTTNYAWDALNRLISLTGGATNTQYAYDGDGNRVQQQLSGGTYQYVNDVATALPTVLDEGGPDGSIDYVRGLSLVSESSSSKQYFYQFDGLGSVTTVTNDAGAHQANYGYDPWGQAAVPNDPPIGLDALGTKNKYKFTGEVIDPNDGLLFLRARYYDPSLGRFLSRDQRPSSLMRPATGNRYQYALSNPIRLSDPTGLSSEEGKVAGASIVNNSLSLASLATSNAISTADTLLNAPPEAPSNPSNGEWQYFQEYGIQYRGRQIKTWSDLSTWEKYKLVWRDLIESYSNLPTGEPGQSPLDFIQILEPNDPRYEVDPNSFGPVLLGPNGLPIDPGTLPRS